MTIIEKIAMSGTFYSKYGYIITPEAETWTMVHQFMHGALMSLLMPEQARIFNIDISKWGSPLDVDPISIQVFEQHYTSPPNTWIRISPSIDTYISYYPCSDLYTKEQKTALLKCLNVLGVSPQDSLVLPSHDLSFRKLRSSLCQ